MIKYLSKNTYEFVKFYKSLQQGAVFNEAVERLKLNTVKDENGDIPIYVWGVEGNYRSFSFTQRIEIGKVIFEEGNIILLFPCEGRTGYQISSKDGVDWGIRPFTVGIGGDVGLPYLEDCLVDQTTIFEMPDQIKKLQYEKQQLQQKKEQLQEKIEQLQHEKDELQDELEQLRREKHQLQQLKKVWFPITTANQLKAVIRKLNIQEDYL